MSLRRRPLKKISSTIGAPNPTITTTAIHCGADDSLGQVPRCPLDVERTGDACDQPVERRYESELEGNAGHDPDRNVERRSRTEFDQVRDRQTAGACLIGGRGEKPDPQADAARERRSHSPSAEDADPGTDQQRRRCVPAEHPENDHCDR